MKSNLELIKECFTAINNFKRSRTLFEKHSKLGNHSQALYHELTMFKEFDRIELSVRAIQKNERRRDDYPDTSDTEELDELIHDKENSLTEKQREAYESLLQVWRTNE